MYNCPEPHATVIDNRDPMHVLYQNTFAYLIDLSLNQDGTSITDNNFKRILLNLLMPEQNGWHLADNISIYIFLNDKLLHCD